VLRNYRFRGALLLYAGDQFRQPAAGFTIFP
jgi:hypothetical protein